MQSKQCPEPKPQPCSGPRVKIQALSFGRRAHAHCLPGWAGRASVSQVPSPGIPSHPAPRQQEGALPAGCLLRLPSSEGPVCLQHCPGLLSHFHGFCHQGWEPGRRRRHFTCVRPLWMQSTLVFFQPCHSEGDFAGPLSSSTPSEGLSLADRAQFWLQAWHLHCWE